MPIAASFHYWSVGLFCLLFWRNPDILSDSESLAAAAPFLVYEFFSLFFETFGGFAAQRNGTVARVAATLAIGGAWLGFCYLFFSRGFHYDGLIWWALASTQAWAGDLIFKKGKVIALAAIRVPGLIAGLFAGAACQTVLPVWGLSAYPMNVLEELTSKAMKQNLSVQGLLFAVIVYCVWVASMTTLVYAKIPGEEKPKTDGAPPARPIGRMDYIALALFAGPLTLCFLSAFLRIDISPVLVVMVPLGPVVSTFYWLAAPEGTYRKLTGLRKT